MEPIRFNTVETSHEAPSPAPAPQAPKKESIEDMLADFVGTLAGLQGEVAKFTIQERERELKMGQAEGAALEKVYEKQKQQVAEYEREKAEAESEPAWKRALIGIATLGMSELAPVLEQGFTSVLHDMGVHNGPLLKYLSKTLTIVAIVAVVVVATAATGGMADAMLASSAAEDGAAGGAEAADVGADAGNGAKSATSVSGAKVASFGLAQGLQGTNLVTSIAKDAGANSWEMGLALGIEIVTSLALGCYGLMGEGGAFSGLANMGSGVNRAMQFGKVVQGLAMLGAAGYSGYQADKEVNVAHDLKKLASTQKHMSLLNFTQEQYNQGLQQANMAVTAALKMSPNSVASQIAQGYRRPEYLV